MTLPVIGNTTAKLAISLTAGQAKTIGFASDVDLPEGTYTLTVGETDIPTTQDDARTLSVAFPAENAALLWQQWRLRLDGSDFAGGPIIETLPANPAGDTTESLAVNLGDSVVNLTVTIGGTPSEAGSTFTIPLVGQWNDPLITGAGIPAPALSLACAMEDLSPVPNGPVHGHRSCVFPGGPPLVPPTVDDIPNDDAWIDIADVADATIYDPFNAPINYFPPEALNVPVWFQIQTTDADGFVTRCYAYLPDGLPDAVADVDLFIFADGVRHSMTVPAPPDDDTPGTAVPQTVTITATAAVTPAAMSYVDGLLAALLARIVALEEA